jgi:hypothetical protein
MKKSRPFLFALACLVGGFIDFTLLFFFRDVFVLRVIATTFIVLGGGAILLMHISALSGDLQDDVKPWLRKVFAKKVGLSGLN